MLLDEILEGFSIHDDRGQLSQQVRALTPGTAQMAMAAFQMGHAAGVAGDEAGKALLAVHVIAHLLKI